MIQSVSSLREPGRGLDERAASRAFLPRHRATIDGKSRHRIGSTESALETERVYGRAVPVTE